MGIKNRDFPNAKELENSLDVVFKVIVPSTRDKSIPISNNAFEKRIKETVKFLTMMFGGSTIDVEKGTYHFKGKIITERVASIIVFTNDKLYNKHDEHIEDFIKEKKKSWGQDSIGFVFNDKMIFI